MLFQDRWFEDDYTRSIVCLSMIEYSIGMFEDC
jgi:hypothetical protein